MSSTNFLDSLNISPQSIFQDNNLIVVEQKDHVDGSFVLHYLVSEFNKMPINDQPKGVLLVLNHQTTEHWQSVSNKIGNSQSQISVLKERGQLRIIDLIHLNFEHILNDEKSSFPDLHVDNLYQICAQEMQKLPNRKLLIVIEDVSNLFYTSDRNERAILEFLRKLRYEIGATVLTLLSSNIPEKRCSYLSSLIAKSLANYSFTVTPLKTGSSKEVNGFLRVQSYLRKIEEPGVNIPIPMDQIYHFKLTDRGVGFVPI